MIESGYSRIPVYQGSLDTVAGILYAKDVLRVLQQSTAAGPPPLTELMRPPVFVLEHQRLSSVLQHFRQTQTHLALVIDEYGQVDGLLTLEDVLEELTGDIADEYDEADTAVVARPDGSFLVDGLLSYADAVDRIGLPSGTLHSVGFLATTVVPGPDRTDARRCTRVRHLWQQLTTKPSCARRGCCRRMSSSA